MKLSIRDKIGKSNYISKKVEESGNVTYIYDKKHIEKRNKDKAEKILKLTQSIKKLRKQVEKDIKDDNQVALVVAVIDETYERIGNQKSAKENGHFGVTTWRKKHIKFGKRLIKISIGGDKWVIS